MANEPKLTNTSTMSASDQLLKEAELVQQGKRDEAVALSQSQISARNAADPTKALTPSQPVTTPSPQPNQKQFYRSGQDIYEAGTNRYIGATEWGRDWSGKAAEVSAPKMPEVKPAESTLPSTITERPEIVQTTDELRRDRQSVRKTAEELDKGISSTFAGEYGLPALDDAMYRSFEDTAAGQAAENEISAAERAIREIRAGNYTEGQKQQIESEIRRAEEQYAPLIREAEAAKKAGLPRAEVAIGELGGFLNTQFAGVAALLPTQGGNFRGAGGELERIASSYDANIADAKSAASRAVNEARLLAVQAIETGAREDLFNAEKAYERARSAHNEGIKLAHQKQSDLIDWAVKSRELRQYEREEVGLTLDSMVGAGYSVEEIPDWYFEELDKRGGYMEGVSRSMFEMAEIERGQAAEVAEMEKLEKMTDILNKIPVGQDVTIGGTTYTGWDMGNMKTGTEEDAQGNVTLWSFNPTTGEIATQNLGAIGKAAGNEIIKTDDGKVISLSPSGQRTVIYDPNTASGSGVLSGGVFDVYPEGSVGGQCGRFVNILTGYSLGLGDSFEQKMTKMDPNITAENVQAGDVFVQQAGVWTGHTGIVTGKSVVDGKIYIDVLESNWNKDERVGRRYSVPAEQFSGFARPGLKPEFQWGTDKGESYDEYFDALNVGGIQLSDKKFEASTKQLEDLLSRGKTGEAKEFLKAVAEEGETSEVRQQLRGREAAIDSLNEIQTLLDDYKEAGGDTGLLSGNFEKMQRKIGRTGNPELVKITNQIQMAIQTYRKAVSGAAFTESEGKEYDRMFPDIKNTKEVNDALISSLKDSFTRNQESFYKSKFYNYDTLFGANSGMASIAPTQAPSILNEYPDKAREIQSLLDEGISEDQIREALKYMR